MEEDKKNEENVGEEQSSLATPDMEKEPETEGLVNLTVKRGKPGLLYQIQIHKEKTIKDLKEMCIDQMETPPQVEDIRIIYRGISIYILYTIK